MGFDKTVRVAAGDLWSGAAEIAERMALAVAREARAFGKNEGIAGVARVARAHAEMAPLRNLLAALRQAPAGRLAGAAREWLARARAGRREVLRAGARLVRSGSVVGIHSYASTVVGALLAAHARGRRFRVFAADSAGHGRHAARALRAAGVTVRVLMDGDFLRSLAKMDLVLVGADAVTPRVLVNGAGTRAIAARAKRLGVPVYVLADPTKIVRGTLRGLGRDPRFDRTPIGWVSVVSGAGTRPRSRARAPRRGR